MSQQNVDVVRRMLQAFNDGDIEALVAECDPSVEWEEQSIPGVDPLYRGHEGVRRWAATIRGMETELGSLEGRLERVKETDENTVIASLCFEGEGTTSGVRVPMHVHLVGTFRDGKIVRRQVFLTLAEALEAVGLSEWRDRRPSNLTTVDIGTVPWVRSTTGHYLDLAEHEGRLARASQERAELARAASREAAFQDTAEELARQAADEQRRAHAHFEAAGRYRRLAVEHREVAG